MVGSAPLTRPTAVTTGSAYRVEYQPLTIATFLQQDVVEVVKKEIIQIQVSD